MNRDAYGRELVLATERDALLAEVTKLREVMKAFVHEVDLSTSERAGTGGGQKTHPRGGFSLANPSTWASLKSWAETMRALIK